MIYFCFFFLATTTTTTTACSDICYHWHCLTNETSNITCPDLSSTTQVTTLTSPTISIATANYIQQLEKENYQLKVGLGVGLGGGMALTTGAAVGSYVYFARR